LGVKEEDISQVKAKMDSLRGQDQQLEKRIQDLDRDIQVLQTQQINKKQLKGVFQEFAELYSEAPLDAKRRLLNVVIEEIRCSVKRGEKTGEMFYKLRGDGTVMKKWEEAKKARSRVTPITKVRLTPRHLN
jgi:TolA-binding protein